MKSNAREQDGSIADRDSAWLANLAREGDHSALERGVRSRPRRHLECRLALTAVDAPPDADPQTSGCGHPDAPPSADLLWMLRPTLTRRHLDAGIRMLRLALPRSHVDEPARR
jgi:hypothetical protein